MEAARVRDISPQTVDGRSNLVTPIIDPCQIITYAGDNKRAGPLFDRFITIPEYFVTDVERRVGASWVVVVKYRIDSRLSGELCNLIARGMQRSHMRGAAWE